MSLQPGKLGFVKIRDKEQTAMTAALVVWPPSRRKRKSFDESGEEESLTDEAEIFHDSDEEDIRSDLETLQRVNSNCMSQQLAGLGNKSESGSGSGA